MDRRQNNGSVKAVSPRHCAATSALCNCCFNCRAGQSHKDNVRCSAVEEQPEAKEVQLSQPSSTSLLMISFGLSWRSSSTSLLLISPGTLLSVKPVSDPDIYIYILISWSQSLSWQIHLYYIDPVFLMQCIMLCIMRLICEAVLCLELVFVKLGQAYCK